MKILWKPIISPRGVRAAGPMMKIVRCFAVIATAGKVRNKSCRTGRTGRTGRTSRTSRTRPNLAKTQISGAILPRLFWIGLFSFAVARAQHFAVFIGLIRLISPMKARC